MDAPPLPKVGKSPALKFTREERSHQIATEVERVSASREQPLAQPSAPGSPERAARQAPSWAVPPREWGWVAAVRAWPWAAGLAHGLPSARVLVAGPSAVLPSSRRATRSRQPW